jgi:hypothetical protein
VTRLGYEGGRLYCVACNEQPEYFEEITSWQRSHVTPRGTLIDVKGGDVRRGRVGVGAQRR